MKVACIGGGTGLFTLLTGIKDGIPGADISAIVSMMDSGGSTGRLRVEFGQLPPGDIRKCLIALSDAPEEMLELMSHRFDTEGTLNGHSLGNLILTAAKDVAGGEYEAISLVERLLAVKGCVYPVTLTDCHLEATLSDGSIVRGETNIDIPKHDCSLHIEELSLVPRAYIFQDAADALIGADYIIIGPGDLYTSIMPNLVVDGMKETLGRAKENGSKIIYVTNTMTKHGETDDYTARIFVDKVHNALGEVKIDAVIVNSGRISRDKRGAYLQENAVPVENDLDGYDMIVLENDLVSQDSFARHDSDKLAKAVEELASRLEHM